MRISIERDLASETTWLRFNAKEQATLRAAANIAEQARTRCAAVVGEYDWEDDPQDMDLAHIEHGVDAIVSGVQVAERFGVMF